MCILLCASGDLANERRSGGKTEPQLPCWWFYQPVYCGSQWRTYYCCPQPLFRLVLASSLLEDPCALDLWRRLAWKISPKVRIQLIWFLLHESGSTLWCRKLCFFSISNLWWNGGGTFNISIFWLIWNFHWWCVWGLSGISYDLTNRSMLEESEGVEITSHTPSFKSIRFVNHSLGEWNLDVSLRCALSLHTSHASN